ncbi:hypothetical protein LIER_15136 [Lithospermum erythrorhizon]|uniref:Retrotransposon Copia-like N-terminal domain-containing protein n=1 Tax=Lithospermum erythrorhizon TaxID=34254 RepID=A0AAV3Q4W6_LITER
MIKKLTKAIEESSKEKEQLISEMVAILEAQLKEMSPNLDSISEHRKKVARYDERVGELNTVTLDRDDILFKVYLRFLVKDGDNNSGSSNNAGGFNLQNLLNASQNQNNGIKPDDPLFLHNLDRSSLVLVSDPLTEKNYNSWSRAMTIAFDAKDKFGFVNGEILTPAETEPTFKQWRKIERYMG